MTAPVGDTVAASMLASYRERHSHPLGWGCSLVAHRDFGFCASCTTVESELAAWRLLAMADRGTPDQPVHT